MTSAAPSFFNSPAGATAPRSATAELVQETLALTRRLFLQLARRPSTLVAGVLQPLIWLVLFGALFANAPEGLLPDGMSYGRFLVRGRSFSNDRAGCQNPVRKSGRLFPGWKWILRFPCGFRPPSVGHAHRGLRRFL